MNRLTQYARSTALSLATIATLYGCGGGGGGGSSPTQPPMGTTVSACVKDPRTDNPATGTYSYKSINGDKSFPLDAAGCFTVQDADSFATFSINAPGYEQRLNVPRSEISAAGNRIYVVSLEEPFHGLFHATQRMTFTGDREAGIIRWPSTCMGETLPNLRVQYANLTNQQITSVRNNLWIISQLTGGDYSVGDATAATNTDHEEGVIKVIGKDMTGGLTNNNITNNQLKGSIISVNSSTSGPNWEGVVRHEFGHALGKIGHASTGLMTPASNSRTTPSALDIDASNVARCLPYGNKAAPASTAQATTAASESRFEFPSTPSFGLSPKQLEKLNQTGERRPAEREDGRMRKSARNHQ